MKQEIRRLPDSELELMQAIWHCESPVSRTDIEAHMSKERKLAPTTILTFLTRLCEKGFLSVERHGKINCYTPLISEKEYLAQESRSILDRLYGGSFNQYGITYALDWRGFCYRIDRYVCSRFLYGIFLRK